jgi:hypothetical protein
MKNIKQLIESTTPMQFVEIVKEPRELSELEYYVLMVTTDEDSPYIKGYDNNCLKPYLIGIEKTSDINKGFYISKNFNSRKNTMRGTTVIVKIYQNELDKYCVLS